MKAAMMEPTTSRSNLFYLFISLVLVFSVAEFASALIFKFASCFRNECDAGYDRYAYKGGLYNFRHSNDT